MKPRSRTLPRLFASIAVGLLATPAIAAVPPPVVAYAGIGLLAERAGAPVAIPPTALVAPQPREWTEAEALQYHFFSQLSLLAAERGWDADEVHRWRDGYFGGAVDDHDLAAASHNNWDYQQTNERRAWGALIIPPIFPGDGSENPTEENAGATPPSCRPIVPNCQILNVGKKLYMGCLAFHKDKILGVECSINNGPFVSQTTWTSNDGVWGYWWELDAANFSTNGRQYVRFRATATDGTQRVYGNNNEFWVLVNCSPSTTQSSGYCKPLLRWVGEDFGLDTQDGLDGVGLNITSGNTCTYVASTRVLSCPSGNKFLRISTATEWKRYIYITGATGITPGLYYVATKTNNNSVILSNAADPAGIALVAPLTDGSAITTSSGPRATIGAGAYKIRLDSSNATYGGTWTTGTRRCDNCTLYLLPGNYAWRRDGAGGVLNATGVDGYCTVERGPGVLRDEVAIIPEGSSYDADTVLSINTCHIKGFDDISLQLSNNGTANCAMWVDDCSVIGNSDINRGIDEICPIAFYRGTQGMLSIQVRAPYSSVSIVITSAGILQVTPSIAGVPQTPYSLDMTTAPYDRIQEVRAALNTDPGLIAYLTDDAGNTTSTSSRNYNELSIRLCQVTATTVTAGAGGAAGTPVDFVWNAPVSTLDRYNATESPAGLFFTNSTMKWMTGGYRAEVQAVGCTVQYYGADAANLPRMLYMCTARTGDKNRYGFADAHADSIQYSPNGGTYDNFIICGYKSYDCQGQMFYASPSITVTCLHVVNYLGVQRNVTQPGTYLAQIGGLSGSPNWQHQMFIHLTFPNTSLSFLGSISVWNNCRWRYLVVEYITNNIAINYPAEVNIDYLHCWGGTQTDVPTKVAHGTTGNPLFVDGAYNAPWDGAHENYQPQAGSPLEFAGPADRWFAVDAVNVARATTATTTGAIETASTPPAPPSSPPARRPSMLVLEE